MSDRARLCMWAILLWGSGLLMGWGLRSMVDFYTQDRSALDAER